jgi:uncharacterized membrane protein
MVIPTGLVHGIDVTAVKAAIVAAEQGTSAEIRVALARFPSWGDVRRAGERAFDVLDMTRTPERNGVLLYLAPRRRQFAVLGDVGIHQRVGAAFWESVARDLAASFQVGDLTGGLRRAIAEIGQTLAVHFPVPPGPKVNALPDEVV